MLVLTIMAGVAEFERARIKERQREGIEAAKKAGVYKGGVVRFDPQLIRDKVAAA
jgi:DNA invertase Pin-like site-specific DNA recombinase